MTVLFSSENTQLKPGYYLKNGIYYRISSSLQYEAGLERKSV